MSEQGAGEEGRSFAEVAGRFPAIVPLPSGRVGAVTGRAGPEAAIPMPGEGRGVVEEGLGSEAGGEAGRREGVMGRRLAGEPGAPGAWGWAVLVVVVGVGVAGGWWWYERGRGGPVVTAAGPAVVPVVPVPVVPPVAAVMAPVAGPVASAPPVAVAPVAAPQVERPDATVTVPTVPVAPPVVTAPVAAAPAVPPAVVAPEFGTVLVYYQPAISEAARQVAAGLGPVSARVELRRAERLPRVPMVRFMHAEDRAGAEALAARLGGADGAWHVLEGSVRSVPPGTLQVLMAGQ